MNKDTLKGGMSVKEIETKFVQTEDVFYLRRNEVAFEVTDEEWDYITAKAARGVLEAIQNLTGEREAEARLEANSGALRSDSTD